MDIVTRALALIAETEQALRELLQEGVSHKEYDQVARLAPLVGQVAAIGSPAADVGLADSKAREFARHPDPEPPSKVSRTPKPQKAGAARGTRRSSAGQQSAPPTAERQREFPYFERDKDKLVKIGWSERDRRTYEHRAPKDVVIRTCEAISHHAAEGQQFKMDAILAELEEDPSAIPSYRAYLALAWLRHEGAVEKDGKEGYLLKGGRLTPERLEALWNGLKERD